MSSITSKFFHEASYAAARCVENNKDMIRWAKSPSYFKLMQTGLPKAEIGRCGCGARGKWYEFIIHALP